LPVVNRFERLFASQWRITMASDALEPVRRRIGQAIAEIHGRADRLSPLDIHARMDAIRQIAAANGLNALEGLAHCSAQLALMPGHRIATRSCLEHMDEALESESPGDCQTILAALAVRLH
jgi:hypothetical protein